MLFLVSTPIGNLADITFRAIDTLKTSDLILCEDTRHSRILLDHYQIKTPLKSYHQFSEASQEEKIIADLKNGKSISLISDAGTPGISDPGERLVARCRKESLPVTPIPGPCAAITALVASGLQTTTFQFTGFLPRQKTELKNTLISFLFYPGTTICYESPNRIHAVLELLSELAPNTPVVIARELTKKFEEFLCDTAIELHAAASTKTFKGEITLLISGDKGNKNQFPDDLTPLEHVHLLMQEFELTKMEAIKLAADLRGVPKKIIYNQVK